MKKGISIILLVCWVSLVLFLSFQNGQETAGTSMHFTQSILRIFMKEEPGWDMLMLWDARFRLAAHFVLLFLYGIIIMITLLQWIDRLWVVTSVSVVSGVFLAVMSEVGKLSIEGRHCDLSEMGLNVVGAIAGALIVMVIHLIFQRHRKQS
ncbi:MAG: VanZ family protein [Lachnospiraceae bacterium]